MRARLIALSFVALVVGCGSSSSGSPDGGGGSGGSGGTSGDGGGGASADKKCGGIAGLTCGPSEWCDFAGETCGSGDELGDCKTQEANPANCGDVVCACDGKTYPTACRAHLAGFDTSDQSCIPGNGGGGVPCAKDADCKPGLKCCPTNGTVSSPIACAPVPASGQCAQLP
jgi:hypothetical protein